VRLIIVRAMFIVVPLVAALVFSAISFLVTVLDPITCVPGMHDIPKVRNGAVFKFVGS
jgi:hypothetical protein